MNNDEIKWTDRTGLKFLKNIGVEEGQKVLDCCCGEGNYSIPAARIVKNKGRVFSLDRNQEKLERLRHKCRKYNLENIETIKKEFTDNLPFDDNYFDLILIYDIFWYFSVNDKKLDKLLQEIYRVSKNDAIISAYPEHINKDILLKEIEANGFKLIKKFRQTLIHDDHLKKSEVWNFKKI